MKSLVILTMIMISGNLFAIEATSIEKERAYGVYHGYKRSDVGVNATICGGRDRNHKDFSESRGVASVDEEGVLHNTKDVR